MTHCMHPFTCRHLKACPAPAYCIANCDSFCFKLSILQCC
uniref:Uncharacterized protein n=1 Tax=Anguilla anguilla TaxID=7936 RepID=A0A0E9REX4_ANGAN